jgi:hypothetical protein
MRPLTIFGAPIVGASLALVLTSCAPFEQIALLPDWVECAVQETGAETTPTIDHTGGVLRLPRGHTLEVPREAVRHDTPVAIRFRQMPTHGVQVRVEATPDIALDVPATLTLSYEGRDCNVNEERDEPAIYRILTVGPPERLPSPAESPKGRAVGSLDRFSLFSIAR